MEAVTAKQVHQMAMNAIKESLKDVYSEIILSATNGKVQAKVRPMTDVEKRFLTGEGYSCSSRNRLGELYTIVSWRFIRE